MGKPETNAECVSAPPYHVTYYCFRPDKESPCVSSAETTRSGANMNNVPCGDVLQHATASPGNSRLRNCGNVTQSRKTGITTHPLVLGGPHRWNAVRQKSCPCFNPLLRASTPGCGRMFICLLKPLTAIPKAGQGLSLFAYKC